MGELKERNRPGTQRRFVVLTLALVISGCAAAPGDPRSAETAPRAGHAGQPGDDERGAAPTMLRVLVREDGKVGDIRLERSSGNAQLDRTAMSAVRNWQFVPKIVDGTPVPDWVDVPFSWQPGDAR